MYRIKDLSRVSERILEIEEKVKSYRELSDAKFNCLFERLSLLEEGSSNAAPDNKKKIRKSSLKKREQEESSEEEEGKERGVLDKEFLENQNPKPQDSVEAHGSKEEDGNKESAENHLVFENAKEEGRILLIWKGPQWNGEDSIEYLRNFIGKREELKVAKVLNKAEKNWIIFGNKEAKERVWKERETFRKEKVFYIDEFLTYNERRARFEMLDRARALRREGKTVKMENKELWIEEAEKGAWFKWCSLRKELKRASAWMVKKDGEWTEEKEDLLNMED